MREKGGTDGWRTQGRFRKDGEVLYLGENAYRILGIAGYGGSSVVYYAAYRDGLNTDQEHHVLIKELYPYDPEGIFIE